MLWSTRRRAKQLKRTSLRSQVVLDTIGYSGTHVKEVGVEQVRDAQFQAEVAPRRDVHLRLHHDRVGRFVEVLCGVRACAYACARVRARARLHVACICTLTVYAMSAPYSGSCATYLRPKTTESTQSIV